MTTATMERATLSSGLGTEITGAKTWLDAVEFAGLDWNVKKVPVYTDVAGVTTEYRRGKVAIVREDTEAPLGITGSDYEPIHNGDVFGFLDPLIDAGAEVLRAGAMLDDSRVFAEVALGEDFTVPGIDVTITNGTDRKVGDLFSPRLYVTTSHDGTTATMARIDMLRLICTNGLVVTDSLWRLKIRHSGDVTAKLALAKQTMSRAIGIQDRFVSRSQRLAAFRVTAAQQEQFIEDLIPNPKGKDEKVSTRIENQRAALLAVIRNGTGLAGWSDSGWGLYNAAAEYADHIIDYHSPENRFRNLNNGRGAGIKDRADVLLDRMMVAAN